MVVFSFNHSFAQSVSLPEAIRIAFEKNQNTQANDQQLLATLEDIKGLTYSAYSPRFSTGVSQSWSQREDLLDSSRTTGRTYSAYASISWNIYRGFQDQFRIRKAMCGYKRTEAIYNSTDTQIPDTKGQIAQAVAGVYMVMVGNISALEFNEKKRKFLEKMESFAATAIEKSQIQNAKADIQIQVGQLVSSQRIAENNYRKVVNDQVPNSLDKFDQVISDIEIPSDYMEAYAIATQKSPDLKTAELGVECQQLAYESSKNENSWKNFSVDASLNASRSGGRSSLPGSEFRGANYGGSISLSKTWVPGMKNYEAGDALRLLSEKNRYEAKLRSAKVNLENSYIKLADLVSSALAYQQGYATVESQVEEAISNLSSQQATVSQVFELLGSLEGRFWNMTGAKSNLIDRKFSIQREIGTLFDRTIGKAP